jgi:hypothetical protein
VRSSFKSQTGGQSITLNVTFTDQLGTPLTFALGLFAAAPGPEP